MELIEREERKREARRNLYTPLQEDPLDLDEIFAVFTDCLSVNYAGFAQKRRRFTPSEYRTYILSHYRYNTLSLQMLARSLHQFAADMHDRHLRFICDDWIDYRNTRVRFRVRAQQDALWVTEAAPETGLVPGDKLLTIQRMTPEQIRRYLRHNGFYSEEPERELWGGYLSMAANAEVEHTDGSRETLALRQFPAEEERYRVALDEPAPGTVRLTLERTDRAAIEALLREHEAVIAGCERLILDLRRCIGGDEDACLPLLPYLVERETPLEELLGEEGYYVNCTKANCELRYRVLSAYGETVSDPEERALLEQERQFYLSHYGKGLVWREPQPSDGRTVRPASVAPHSVIVITDTFCEDEGELFAAACRRCGAKVRTVGRPTMGTLDFFDPITVQLNAHMSLAYPIAMSKAAYEGHGIADKGLPVDRYIPWTPAEIREDQLLRAALEFS